MKIIEKTTYTIDLDVDAHGSPSARATYIHTKEDDGPGTNTLHIYSGDKTVQLNGKAASQLLDFLEDVV